MQDADGFQGYEGSKFHVFLPSLRVQFLKLSVLATGSGPKQELWSVKRWAGKDVHRIFIMGVVLEINCGNIHRAVILGKTKSDEEEKKMHLWECCLAILTVPLDCVNSWVSTLYLQKHCSYAVISGAFAMLAYKYGCLLFIILWLENLSHSAGRT